MDTSKISKMYENFYLTNIKNYLKFKDVTLHIDITLIIFTRKKFNPTKIKKLII